jgi:hypothetical protein
MFSRAQRRFAIKIYNCIQMRDYYDYPRQSRGTRLRGRFMAFAYIDLMKGVFIDSPAC